MSLVSNPAVPLLLVVCTGNICRSPMGEVLLSHYLANAGATAQVVSRGLGAPVGRRPHRYACEVAAAHGLPLPEDKRASAITTAEIAAATLVLVMDEGHVRDMRRRFPTASGKVFLMGRWQEREVPDPVNDPRDSFERAWLLLEDGAKAWADKLVTAGMVPVQLHA